MGGLPEQEKAKVKRVNETIEKITRREPLSEEQLVPEEVKPEEVKPEPEVKEETPKEEISQPEETVSKTEYEELKHKLDVLKGKLDKEVPYYAEQNRFLMETIQKLEAENARRDQESKEKTKKTISKLEEDPVFKSLQESDPEMAKALSLTHEKTLETARQILQEYKEGTDAERQRDQTSRFQEKSSQFYGELADAGYPNINALYSNPDFQAFLYKEEPGSGLQYGALIERAFSKFDSPRVVRFLDVFYGKKPTSDIPKIKGIDTAKVDPNKLANKMGAPRAGGSSSDTPRDGDALKDKNKAVHDLVAIRESKIHKRFSGTESDYKKEEERLLKIISGSG